MLLAEHLGLALLLLLAPLPNGLLPDGVYLMSGALAMTVWLARALFLPMFPSALAMSIDLFGPSIRAL